MTCLVWLQRDLRVTDHAPLVYAANLDQPFVVAYFHQPDCVIGEANALRLSYSLQALQTRISKMGGRLLMLEGRYSSTMERLLQHFNITQVLYHHEVGRVYDQAQECMQNLCRIHRVHIRAFNQCLSPPQDVLSQRGHIYSSFVYFYKTLQNNFNKLPLPQKTLQDLSFAHAENAPQEWLGLPQSLQNLQRKPWAKRLMSAHQGYGETTAWQVFEEFCQTRLQTYSDHQAVLTDAATSRLSEMIHFGEISVRQMLVKLLNLKSTSRVWQAPADLYIRYLSMREFARYLMQHYPETEYQAIQDSCSEADCNEEHLDYQKWKDGQTGIPIIDAAMRQLWQTGWQHPQLRILCSTWLTRNLNHCWPLGHNWYLNTLMDAEPAVSAMNWQRCAGCGVDKAPNLKKYLNPVQMGKNLDPDGSYIREWLPELSALSHEHIHSPWRYPSECLKQGIKLGRDYPLMSYNPIATKRYYLERTWPKQNNVF